MKERHLRAEPSSSSAEIVVEAEAEAAADERRIKQQARLGF